MRAIKEALSGHPCPWIGKIPKLLSARHLQGIADDLLRGHVPAGPEELSLFVEYTIGDENSSGNPATQNFYCDAEKLAQYLNEKLLRHLRHT